MGRKLESIPADYELSPDGKKRTVLPCIKVGGTADAYLLIHQQAVTAEFSETLAGQLGKKAAGIENIEISGCRLESFDFLRLFPSVKRLCFLADSGSGWQEMPTVETVTSLHLHNLKQDHRYLDNTAFLARFPSLEYLFVAMLGVNSLPELPKLEKLRVVMGTFRNENDVHESCDFSSFRAAPALKIFDGFSPVDRYRIPAEAFIPILENPTLESFCYSQMYAREDKKLAALIEQINPKLKQTSLSYNETFRIRCEEIL